MEPSYIPLDGEVIPPQDLRLPRSRQAAGFLTRQPPIPFVRLVECRRAGQANQLELVVLDVEVEVSQKPVHDIRRTERVAAVFSEDDRLSPDVLALRDDFPAVPHLNIRPFEHPRSLCLSDLPFAEEKIRWTARAFVERIREWLALTAEGALHQDDQPLEPLLAGDALRIILPWDLFAGDREHLFVYGIGESGRSLILRAERKQRGIGGEKSLEFVAVPIESAPHTHGVIRWQPRNLKELHEFLSSVGTDLIAELRSRLRSWEADKSYLGARLILVVSLPKRRTDDGDIESRETWGFLTEATVQDVGKAIDAWGMYKGHRGILLKTDIEKQGEDVELGLLLPCFTLSRTAAAVLNGLPERCANKITAVGAGALGSQVIKNLVRQGYGEWIVVDDDPLLPHNLARHGLDGAALGFPKAHAVAMEANSTIDGEPIAKAIVANVLEPKDSAEAVSRALREADVALDLAASVAVARHLAIAEEVSGRRVSVFLNPTGYDLVVLAEDAERSIRLDSLEMQYYRFLSTESQLADHLRAADGRVRYGHSCRDVSNRIPQELVALHSGIASRAIRHALQEPVAKIAIWSADEHMGVKHLQASPAGMHEICFGTWTVCTDQWLLDKVARLRREKLPRETGGVLLGSFDMERRIAYVVDTIPSPPDSLEQPTVYIRGSQGLREEVERVRTATGGWLEYVGEWHSHPAGASTRCSPDDRTLFSWLSDEVYKDGHPALMLIAGDGKQSWYVESVEPICSG